MSEASFTDVKWRIPNDLYDRLKAEAAKEVNMAVSTFALSFLKRHFPPLAAAPGFVSPPHKALTVKAPAQTTLAKAPSNPEDDAERRRVEALVAEWDEEDGE